eukprot:10764753-Ditylum_brightwellii.AAC.1
MTKGKTVDVVSNGDKKSNIEKDTFDVIMKRGHTCEKKDVLELHVDAIYDDAFSILHPLVEEIEKNSLG